MRIPEFLLSFRFLSVAGRRKESFIIKVPLCRTGNSGIKILNGSSRIHCPATNYGEGVDLKIKFFVVVLHIQMMLLKPNANIAKRRSLISVAEASGRFPSTRSRPCETFFAAYVQAFADKALLAINELPIPP
ncbi:hypothetical protein CEXT_217561 [Caerostris extrusa]|uniref:Uncharacterized protein n=1 Tax=Caerostris extrusa TaxID=172846 RepID=A0AAV4VMQ5_CAEEX|nr:hypothetical protein CEXT_217561 [Caerostris extrusa]